MQKKLQNAFTLIEIMVGILIVSMVMITGFYAYSKMGIGKINLIEQTDIQKDSFYFSEKLFQLVKEGGLVDYEEYFNRKVVGIATSSGHYSKLTGFGNFGAGGSVGSNTYGAGYYYCRSGVGDGNKMGEEGCYSSAAYNNASTVFIGEPQRYGQYSFQFIDYNSNYNEDMGDEDGDDEIRGDDDDEFLGRGPTVFVAGTNVHELYLLSGDGKSRTYFRWRIETDPDARPGELCNDSGTGGCLGTIEFLKLQGKDRGLDHNKDEADEDGTQYDGVIDTWIIDPQFAGGSDEVIAGQSDDSVYRKRLFPTSINVSNFKVYVYPNIDYTYAWRTAGDEANISPYVILNYSLRPSWKTRQLLGGREGKEININSVIDLTEIFSN